MPRLHPASLARSALDGMHLAAMGARLARDLPRYLRTPLSLEDARAQVSRELATREERFLDLVDRAVYRGPV